MTSSRCWRRSSARRTKPSRTCRSSSPRWRSRWARCRKDSSSAREELKEHGPPTDILDPRVAARRVERADAGQRARPIPRGIHRAGRGAAANIRCCWVATRTAPTPVFAAYRAFCESPKHADRCKRSDPWDARDFVHPMIVQGRARFRHPSSASPTASRFASAR